MDAVLEDVKFFRECNGGTIVENSNYGLKRDIPLMKRVSEETGVNIVAGTGIYTLQLYRFLSGVSRIIDLRFHRRLSLSIAFKSSVFFKNSCEISSINIQYTIVTL